jgi:hypothetical protein
VIGVSTALRADRADPRAVRRIGIIGLESSRPRRFIHHLNARRALDGVRVTAIATSPDETLPAGFLDELRAAGAVDIAAGGVDIAGGGIDVVGGGPDELAARVDAVIDCTRDGARHRWHVEPLLAGGVPAFVDKPLATTASAAASMISAARSGRAVLMSYSGYRDALELGEVAASLSSSGPARADRIEVTGPADPSSPYGGLSYYGIHHVEIALEILRRAGLPLEGIRSHTTREPSGVRTRFTVDGIRVVLSFLRAPEGRPFSVTANAGGVVTEWVLTLPPEYNERMVERFVGACETGVWPHPASEMLASVALIEGVVAAL